MGSTLPTVHTPRGREGKGKEKKRKEELLSK
jgi:hypothetical protein